MRIASDVLDGVIMPPVGQNIFRSVAAGNNEDWDTALDVAKAAAADAPAYAPAQLHLGTVYAKLAEAGRDTKTNTDAAISAYEQAIKIEPEFGIAHYNLGVALAAREAAWTLDDPQRPDLPNSLKHLQKAQSLGIKVPADLLLRVEEQLKPPGVDCANKLGFFKQNGADWLKWCVEIPARRRAL